MGYLTQQMLDTIKHITGDNFFLSGRQRTGALCVQHSPTAAVLSTNTAFERKCDFCVSPFLPGIAEAQVICGRIVKRHLIAYFIGNISAKRVSKFVHV